MNRFFSATILLALLTTVFSCGKQASDYLEGQELSLYINESRAGSDIDRSKSSALNTNESTVSVSFVSDKSADLSLHFNFMKNSGITDGETCDIMLKNIPYSIISGVVSLNANEIQGFVTLNIVNERIVFSDVTVSGWMNITTPSADIKIKGMAKDRPLALVISGVTSDKSLAGYNPEIGFVDIGLLELYDVYFTNESSSECTVKDAKEFLSLTIPPGKTENQMVNGFVFEDDNWLSVVYSGGEPQNYRIDNMTRVIVGLECQESYDFFLTTAANKIEPNYYTVQHYSLQ